MWIVAVRRRARADRATSLEAGRVERILDAEPRIRELKAALGMNDNERVTETALHMNIVGMATLEPGVLYTGGMTVWNTEERILWKTLKYAADAFSAKIRLAAVSMDPTPVILESMLAGPWQRQRSLQTLAPGVLASAADAMYLPARAGGGSTSGSALLRSWGCGRPQDVNVVLVPVVLAMAIVSGHWHRLMFTIRGTLFRWRIFQHWPPKAHFARQSNDARRLEDGRRQQDSEPLPVDADEHLRAVANHLREWQPDICFEGEDDEDGRREGVRQTLLRDVNFLERMARQLDATPSFEEMLRKYPVVRLLECVRVAHLIKDAWALRPNLEMLRQRFLPLWTSPNPTGAHHWPTTPHRPPHP